MIPLLISDLLKSLGLGGAIVTTVSVLIAAYHGKGILDFFSRIGTWVRIAGAIGVLLALATVGVIPGVDVQIQFGELVSAVGPTLDWVWEFVQGWIPFL